MEMDYRRYIRETGKGFSTMNPSAATAVASNGSEILLKPKYSKVIAYTVVGECSDLMYLDINGNIVYYTMLIFYQHDMEPTIGEKITLEQAIQKFKRAASLREQEGGKDAHR